MEIVRRAATVSGRVQGVSFRYYTDLEANRRGLTGWVRNVADGTVQLEVQGPREQVDDLLRWVRTGPPHAVVDGIDVRELDPVAREDGFHVTR